MLLLALCAGGSAGVQRPLCGGTGAAASVRDANERARSTSKWIRRSGRS
jgi:hypothetical protein